jgi:hypothetical protein
MSDTRSGTPKQSYSTEKSAPNMNLFFAAATKEELAHEQEFPRSYDPKFFLRFLPKDQETNAARLAQGQPDGLLSWPKSSAYAFLAVCVEEYLKKQHLGAPFEELIKDLYILLDPLLRHSVSQISLIGRTKDISAQTKSVNIITSTVLNDPNTIQSEKEISNLYLALMNGSSKTSKAISLKNLASFCLATGRLPQAEELSTKNSYNNKKADIIR